MVQVAVDDVRRADTRPISWFAGVRQMDYVRARTVASSSYKFTYSGEETGKRDPCLSPCLCVTSRQSVLGIPCSYEPSAFAVDRHGKAESTRQRREGTAKRPTAAFLAAMHVLRR